MKITKVTATVIDDNGRGQSVTIERCYESYQQYGATVDVLRFTSDLAKAVTPFLDNDECEDEEE